MTDFYFTRYKKNQINQILPVLKEAKISTNKHDSTHEPFFLKGENQDFEINFQKIGDVPEGLNHSIKLLFEIIGSPDKEIYLGPWTILSFNKCMENYQQYCKDGQKIVFDIAFMYLGMGHVKILSCDLDTHLLFYRRDGGSSGWDREANYQDLLKYDGTTNYQFFFKNWFYKIDHTINIID